MRFFEDLPQPDQPKGEPPRPTAPEWLGPPHDIMGGVVPVAESIVRTEHLFVGLPSVTAYPSGLAFGLLVAVRRGALSRERWEELSASTWAGRRRPGTSPPGEGALRIGVELADGRRTRTTDRSAVGRPGVRPEPPLLVERHGTGSGGPWTMERRTELWLWPLPEGETLSLVLQWSDLDVPVTFHRVDLAPVRDAADRAVPYWL